MQTSDLTEATVRRLAEAGDDQGAVISLYLDLDPSQFATAPARQSQISSLLDEAGRSERALEDLSHDERKRLREAIERVRGFLEDGELAADGAHGLAVFCASGGGLFEALKLPRSVASEVRIAPKPYIEPLVDLSARGDWCVVLVGRRTGRIMRGSAERLEEAADVSDDWSPKHEEGGRSQSRQQRGEAKEAGDHLERVADALFRRFKHAPFDHLLIAANQELAPAFEHALHPYLRERLAGHMDIDEAEAAPDEVLASARPLIEAEERRRERDALDRLEQGVGAGGRGAAGLEDVLEALYERRVEILLIEEGLAAAGVRCPRCGWLGGEGVARCPADETEVERLDDVLEPAVELAVTQSAAVIRPRHFDDLDGIGAVLRY